MNLENVKRIFRKWKFYKYLVLLKKKSRDNFEVIHHEIKRWDMNRRKGLRMSCLYGDHMILQCEEPLQIKGKAQPGEWVTVCIAGQEEKVCCQSDGCWEIEFLPLQAGGPYTLEISARSGKLIYEEVYAGEVWLCSGQSNMVVTISSYLESNKFEKDDIFDSYNNTPFRFFNMETIWPTYPVKWNKVVNYCINRYSYMRPGKWLDCERDMINSLSAIAYFYGKILSQQLHRPIGLIVNPVGGTAEYCWIERRMMQKEYPQILSDWYKNQKVTRWMKERAILNLGKEYSEYEQLHPYHPGYCFETFIRPICDYTIKGCIWYAGGSSAQLGDVEPFEKLQELQIKNWREVWGKCFPFYYVQLHGMNYEKTFGRRDHYDYPSLRNSQRKLLSKIPLLGMAVSYDLSDIDNTHYRNRKPVGDRLSRLALYNTYGKKDIIPCGPLFHEALLRENLIYIRFDWSEGLCTKDGEEPKNFEVAGIDKCFYPARASIVGEEVVLSCAEVIDPVWVHYAFEEYPIEANLVNGEGLPAACFEDRISSLI
nr:hypothetical protein [Parabacteroides goldsteinii]